MQTTEKTLNANARAPGGLEWIPLSSPKLSLAFTYAYKLTNSDEKFVSGFPKLLCFLCPAWPEIEIYILKIGFILPWRLPELF